ncbi:hypothetical protein MHU86_12229 [Fragilaria crotonensis]|nr:hypothetical protein MHU86_12229 [Fragilaria crotonensis]
MQRVNHPRRVPSEADDPITSQRQDSLENMPSMTDDDGEQLTEDELDFDQAERTPRTKGRKIMDQIAKTVNFDQFARSVATSTAKTGKQVVKQGKKVELLLERRSSLQFRGQRPPFNIQRNRRPETRRRRKSHLSKNKQAQKGKRIFGGESHSQAFREEEFGHLENAPNLTRRATVAIRAVVTNNVPRPQSDFKCRAFFADGKIL